MGGNSTTRNARIVHSVAFDAWFAYTGETTAPRPVTRREDTLLEETLYEEELLPVCSPALLAARGRPLLYDLGWDADWAYWFARQGQSTPDLCVSNSQFSR